MSTASTLAVDARWQTSVSTVKVYDVSTFSNYIDDHFNKKQIMGFWPFLKFKFCHGLSTYVPTVDKYEVRIYQALDVKF